MDKQPWDGGPMPVAGQRYVNLTFRNGQEVLAQLAGGFEWQHVADPDLSDPRSPAWWDITGWCPFGTELVGAP